MLLILPDDLLCLQIHTVASPNKVHASKETDDLKHLQLHTVGSQVCSAIKVCHLIDLPTYKIVNSLQYKHFLISLIFLPHA